MEVGERACSRFLPALASRSGRFHVRFGARLVPALARLGRRCYLHAVFGVGTLEMVVIAVVAMLLFKPSELPKMLRQVTRFWGQLRSTADEFRDTLMTADGMDELQEMVQGTKAQLRGVEDEARREMMKARVQMRKAQQKLALTQKVRQEQRRATEPAAPAKPAASDASPASDTAATVSPPGTEPARDVNQGAA